MALQGLYQLDVQQAQADVDVVETLTPLLAEAELTGPLADYARQLVVGVWRQREQYDEMISGVADHWDLSRMAVVDRNLLRLALHELIEKPAVPIRVVFDEAIELGKEFGEAETPHFVNGVLDAIWKRHPVCRAARPEAEKTENKDAAPQARKSGTS